MAGLFSATLGDDPVAPAEIADDSVVVTDRRETPPALGSAVSM